MSKKEIIITVTDITPMQKNQPRSNASSKTQKIIVLNKKLNDLKILEEECTICLNIIKSNHQIWYCKVCYLELHLDCAQRWAESVLKNDKKQSWSCPTCRSEIEEVPTTSYCYCGKICNPESQCASLSRLMPHCCDNICGKVGCGGRGKHCSHPCVSTCHKGKCPPCTSTVIVKCPCGAKCMPIQCSMIPQLESVVPVCTNICNKLLICGSHFCKDICHYGACRPCELIANTIHCYCGKNKVDYKCGHNPEIKTYSCKNVCERELTCKLHKCQEICHPGLCNLCPLDPSVVKTCHCGKVSLTSDQLNCRVKCTDPVPSCNQTCGKQLICRNEFYSPNSKYHTCPQICHPSKCPECSLTTRVKCLCGKSFVIFPCISVFYTTPELKLEPRCDKKCGKILSCGKHSCCEKCCLEPASRHICNQICDQILECGHKCGRACHKKACKPCSVLIQYPIFCTCGRTMLNPPSICSDLFPYCPNFCPKKCPMGHTNPHPCHSVNTKCSPCQVIVRKPCSNGHGTFCTIECHIEKVTCTARCNKTLPCTHLCPRLCHLDPCITDTSTTCNQLCVIKIPRCNHNCGQKCHWPKPCPKASCMERITLYCKCKYRMETTLCHILTNYLDSSPSSLPVDPQQTDREYVLVCAVRCEINKRNFNLAKALELKNNPESGFICSLNRLLSMSDLKEFELKPC